MNNAKHTQNLNNLSLFLLTHQHYIARNNNGILTNRTFQREWLAPCVTSFLQRSLDLTDLT